MKAIVMSLLNTRGAAGADEDEIETAVFAASDAKTTWLAWQMVIDGQLALDVRDGEPILSAR